MWTGCTTQWLQCYSGLSGVELGCLDEEEVGYVLVGGCVHYTKRNGMSGQQCSMLDHCVV